MLISAARTERRRHFFGGDMKTDRTLNRLKHKLDALALEQLREVAAQLYQELEQARDDLTRAEENADFWRDQVFAIQEQLAQDNKSLGMNQAGELSVIPA
jgi:hypothetical protein